MNKFAAAVVVAALAVSGVGAGPCKASPRPTLTTTPGVDPVSTSSLISIPVETPVSTPIEVPVSSPATTPIEIPVSTPVPTPIVTPAPTPDPSPAQELCTLADDAASLEDTVCGTLGTLGSTDQVVTQRDGLTLEECATFANTYDGIEGQTGAQSFLYSDDAQICLLFAPRAAGVSDFSASSSGLFRQYDFNCFSCPSGNDDFVARCNPVAELPTDHVCGTRGDLSDDPLYVLASSTALPWDCLDLCDQNPSCLTLGIADDLTCTLYSERPDVLNFEVDADGTEGTEQFVFERACFTCDARDATGSIAEILAVNDKK